MSTSAKIPAGPQTKRRTFLFISRTAGYGGTEKHLFQLISRLGPNVESTIVCTHLDPFTERLQDAGGAKVAIRSEPNVRTLRDWVRLFRTYHADTVVLVYGWLDAIKPRAAAAARLAGIRKLYAIQHLIPPAVDSVFEGSRFRELEERVVGNRHKIAARLCNKTICVSDAVRNALLKDYSFPSKKTFTIRNGVSISEFAPDPRGRHSLRSELGVAADQALLVCSARLSVEKGLEVLLAAMDRLKRAGIKCKCVVVGDGNLRDALEAQIRSLELTDFVTLLGFQSDIRPYLNAGDIFVLTSYKEGLPLSVLEAMACGLPCVVTDAGGSAEAVTHGVNGFVVPQGDDEKVAAALSHLISNAGERARMSGLARSNACADFDLEVQMGKIKSVILN